MIDFIDSKIKDKKKSAAGEKLPLIPLRGVVCFPSVMLPLLIGRQSSINAVMYAYENNIPLLLATQSDQNEEDPEVGDIYDVGCIATIFEVMNMPKNMIRIVAQGIKRAKIKKYYQKDQFYMVEYLELDTYEVETDKQETEVIFRSVKERFSNYLKTNPRFNEESVRGILSIEDKEKFIDHVVYNLPSQVNDKQQILEEQNLNERLTKLLALIQKEKDILKIEDEINKRVQERLEKMQKKFFLNEQLKEIRKELKEEDGTDENTSEIREKLKNKNLPDHVKSKIDKELTRLTRIPNMSPEYTVLYNYVEWLSDIPWGVFTDDDKDILEAEKILDEEHYGLKEVKERILDFIAVRQLNPQSRGSILCLVGPPGTGKTSLSKSIAKALNRKFVRVSLGGIRDEAEIRGHRRTYVGALPGKIVQMLKKAETMNPVILLDEVDKMTMDFRGDPSSALLEVLDPEQNMNFNDHYLTLDIDLSYVFFITTANDLYKIPEPLRDRMEIIRIPGYTEYEKKEIAKKFLIPKQLHENGIEEMDISIGDKSLIEVIHYYTREAGVRGLERTIAKIARKIAREKIKKKITSFRLTQKKLKEFLGIQKYDFTKARIEPKTGVIAGLAWTPKGGDVLYVESSVYEGKGNLLLTGKLGDVMKESAQIAFSYAKSVAGDFKIPPEKFTDYNLHIHVPEGAIPKDGPSAGITMTSSIVSVLSGRKARNDCAMTGEVTLKGEILPIGGLREKLLAAKRSGIYHVIVPKKNEKDVIEMEKQIKDKMKITFVSHVDEVLDIILLDDAEKTDRNDLDFADGKTD